MNNDLKQLRDLIIKNKELSNEIEILKNKIYESFENMSQEDMALSDGKLIGDNIEVTYFKPSKSKRLSTTALKQDGIYDNYVTEVDKKSYIRVHVLGDK